MIHNTTVKNSYHFQTVNRKIEKIYLDERLSERLSFTRFCASGNRPAFIGGGNERDEIAVKRRK